MPAMSPLILPFHRGFENEPQTIAERVVTCPAVPSRTRLAAGATENYVTLALNDAKAWGMTALMAMVGWESACYGYVSPGDIFLFPGTYDGDPPPYIGTVNINCVTPHPLQASPKKPLHAQMCALLGETPDHFIGFSLTYPWFVADGVGYNSGICNPKWFGNRTIPTDCDGVDWQQVLYNALARWPTRAARSYDTGSQNSVALDSDGNAIEVHVGTGNLYYTVGQVAYGSDIEWGRSTRYDSGKSSAVAMDDQGNVVEVHSSGTDLYYTVGHADFSGKTITFAKPGKYGKGSSNAVALQPDGLVVATGVRGGDLYYQVGFANFSAGTIDFASEAKYGSGESSAVAVKGDNTVVEVHVGTDGLYYQVGRVNPGKRSIEFGASNPYGTGVFNAVAMNSRGTVVEVHVEAGGSLSYRLGVVDSSRAAIDFGPDSHYDYGDRCAVAINSRNVVAEVDTYQSHLYSRAAWML